MEINLFQENNSVLERPYTASFRPTAGREPTRLPSHDTTEEAIRASTYHPLAGTLYVCKAYGTVKQRKTVINVVADRILNQEEISQ